MVEVGHDFVRHGINLAFGGSRYIPCLDLLRGSGLGILGMGSIRHGIFTDTGHSELLHGKGVSDFGG